MLRRMGMGGRRAPVRRVISDGGKRNGLLARKAPNTARANILARDALTRGAWAVS